MPTGDRPPRLQPPPRISAEPGRGHSGAPGNTPGRSPGIKKAGIALLFTGLAVAVVTVFWVLPRWAGSRQTTGNVQTQMTGVSSAAGDSPTAPPSPTAAPVITVPTPTRAPHPSSAHRRRDEPTDPDITRTAEPSDEAEFMAAMSRGLEALDRGRWEIAREAFSAASRLRPGAPEAADGLARANAAERRAAVIAGIRRGRELETSEAWTEAEKVYTQVLTIDPEAADALEGRDRSAGRAVLDSRLEYHIGHPNRLSSANVYEDAADLLVQARELQPVGPRLRSQLSRLEQILKVASTPIPVVVVSDNLTEVVIYRVDRLGTLSRRELNLRPGVYTAVGSREGFRDVRVQFEVSANGPPTTVSVVCTEAL